MQYGLFILLEEAAEGACRLEGVDLVGLHGLLASLVQGDVHLSSLALDFLPLG